jgi:rhodanese-related sulfurtransferase
MTAYMNPLTPREIADRLTRREITLVDIREPDEFAREHIEGAVSLPLSKLEQAHLNLGPARNVVFHCGSGARTSNACGRLLAIADGSASVMDGGLNAWKREGLPTSVDRKRPIEIMRQVQITAGGLVLTGVTLGAFVHPAWLAASAVIGAGLVFAGASGWCGMARLLQLMPWNRVRA